MDEELKEIFGITKGDGLIYLSFVLAILGYFVNNFLLLSLFYLGSLVSGVYSIKIGSRKNKKLDNFLNTIKKYAYYVCFVVVILIILFRIFLLFIV